MAGQLTGGQFIELLCNYPAMATEFWLEILVQYSIKTTESEAQMLVRSVREILLADWIPIETVRAKTQQENPLCRSKHSGHSIHITNFDQTVWSANCRPKLMKYSG